MLIRSLIITARPQQWIKNLFVFAALVFGQQPQGHLQAFMDPRLVFRSFSGFIIFCCISSSVYFLNDIFDLKQDKAHPIKCKRPLASGQLSIQTAVIAFIVLCVAALFFSFFLNLKFFCTTLGYFVINLLYSLYLKHIVILDVLLIAVGFVLRAVAGAYAITVPISSWLYLCTILISLFLALSKRRHEIVLLEDTANHHRAILSEYSTIFLDQMIAVVTSSTLMAYALYTMSSDVIGKFRTTNLKFTIPFVMYGIFRYLYLVYQKEEGGSPAEMLLTDRPLLINILLWFLSCVIVLLTAGRVS